MPDLLRVAVAQPLTVALDVERNVAAHDDLIRAAEARIIVFPEMSLTGYEFSAAALDPGDRRLGPLIETCRATGSVALVGAPVEGADGGKSIGILRIDGHGATLAYRKMWLGDAELGVFVPGAEPSVIEVDGWRIGLGVCKDTGVPRHAADTAALGIDVYAAGVLEHMADRHVQPERARRIIERHGVWVAVASFAGATGEGFDTAAGASTIWRPDGEAVAQAGAGTGAVVAAPIG
jgi:predicted amidohydrolase